MKKVISIFLAVLMAFSCCGVLAAAVEEEESTKKPISESLNDMVGIDFTNLLNNPELGNVDALKNADSTEQFEQAMLSNVDFMGLNINYMYNSTDPIYWPNISISRSDLALVYGNLNAYLLKLKKEKLSNYRFYTNENATKLCNRIGKLYDPNFKDMKITFDTNPTSSEEFYQQICERSGLTEWIQKQWIDPNDTTHVVPDTQYVALCTVLGMRLDDLPAPERDIKDASKVAPLLVKSIVEYKAQGPFAHVIEVARKFTLTYDYYLSKAIIPFFQKYIDAGRTTVAQLKTFKGLLNVVFNGGNPNDSTKMQFIAPPSYRIAITKDEVENFLYLIIYTNLLGAYKNNRNVVQGYKNTINASADFNDSQKERLIAIVGMLFEGKFAEVEPTLSGISMEIIKDTPTNLKNMLFGFFGRFLDGLYGIFDRIYQALRKFL